MDVCGVMIRFVWDTLKELENFLKHGVDFETAKKAFADPKRRILHDLSHSKEEQRFFCLGNVEGKILTVRFTYRDLDIRIIGAGFWRKGKITYEKENEKKN